MCASCGCGCKHGVAAKGCTCKCKDCREARTNSVEKSYVIAKALRGFDDVEKGLSEMAYRATQPFVRAAERSGLTGRAAEISEKAKFKAFMAKHRIKDASFNAQYALGEAKDTVRRNVSAGADRVRFSRAGSSVNDKISRIKRGY